MLGTDSIKKEDRWACEVIKGGRVGSEWIGTSDG